jgi:hypothetical protein
MDIRDKAYLAHVWLFIFCGFLDAMWQTTAYWVMGAMSNDPAKLAYFTGFCTSARLASSSPSSTKVIYIKDKSIQSAGGAGVWRADAVKTPYVYH